MVKNILRLWTINRVFIRHGLDELVFHIPFLRPLSFIYHLSPWNWGKQETRPRGERIRRALEDLGPIFIKFGQMLSTRRDLLPDDIANELTRLQDRVPPFSSQQARHMIEKAYGKPVTEVFKHFETDPMASASIAQVHAAQLWNGKDVVVKVLRPGIEKTIRQDVELMYLMASLVQRYWKEARRLRPVEVVAEYEKTIFDELDLVREAANASQIRRNFEGNPTLYVPEIYWDYTHPNVMVMERIYGIPVGDIPRLQALGVNFKRLGELGVEVFFTQVFRHNFFHADMHPGNIFVDPKNPNEPQYMAVDFGIVGTLAPADKRYLAENFYAFFNRDYKRVAELHVESGWVPPATRVDEFESAIRSVCEPILNLPIKDISFGHFLLRLFQTARRFNMEVQPQLVLLQKTLLNIEGLGRQLYPDLDLWSTAKPFIERWMDEQVGVRALFHGAKVNLPKFLENLPYMPNMLHDIMQQTAQHKLKMQWESQQLEELRREMRRGQRINQGLLVAGIVLVLFALLYRGGLAS
ncbi:MAG TPA: ubiquinone biosynthesis regulatory protein kinase UbiB [Candidatus Thiothrix moscowensis]|uniref:ubiquinone biosynthesis regulatory protein kinase UbiB n=1 Tax=unclassified Thiothrix TaxID=2636184 RepID=UPI0025FE80E4|nr:MULTISPECIES: ubiquinone biosynthesis regulatory protein kinase UbiB [unclassified Thiothrix]HRJ51282.1 ubiquinone biosynthesis regulatory protein kinase UbiB [Candidatus Thiothrix moscowensis]HRJ91663.1 ubiquinone biosynthesis regulatory protein kinase UbiB [Candidatus Thiothrix moscowensis]